MKHYTREQWIYALCLLLAIIGSCMSCRQENSFDQLRIRYFNMLATPDADLTDSIVKSRIKVIDTSAAMIWESMDKSPERENLWESDKYVKFVFGQFPRGTLSSRIGSSLGKLSQLALAYKTKGSKYEGNSRLKKDILDGLDWMLLHRYNPTIAWYDNWWDWVIGIPLTLDNLLVLMYDDLSKGQIDKAVESMNHFAPDVTYQGASTGANKIWQCKNMVLRGIISHNAAQIKMGIKGLDTEFNYVETKDGYYRDGSFVQHQWHAYTGGYGRSMLREMTDILVTVRGSDWDFPEEHRKMIYEWVHNSFEPVIYRGALMDMVRGREASRPEQDREAGHSLLMTFIRLSEIAPETEKKRLQSFIKSNIQADTYHHFMDDVPTYLLPAVKKIMNDPAIIPAKPRAQTKIFAAMDRVVHIRPGFAFGLSMSSSRIENYEAINGENRKGWYTGDGMTYLYDNDLRQYSDGFWPTYNAYRPAGTTESMRPRKAESLPFANGLLYADGYKSPQDWTGGASINDAYAMVGMWYDAQDCSLEAKKSWFMAGDEIVALGAGISSRDNQDIETIVENRKLNEGSEYKFRVDGKEVLSREGRLEATCTWAHFEGMNENTAVGYYFPGTVAINLLRETREGSWSDINVGPKDLLRRSYFTLWVDHGKNPAHATYAYVLLPGRSVSETEQYTRKPTVEILTNSPEVQAVHHKTENVTGWNFWKASSGFVYGVKTDAPSAIIQKETEKEWIIGVSDPTQKANTIVVTFDRSALACEVENPNIKVLSFSPYLQIQVNVSGALGRTHTAIFKK